MTREELLNSREWHIIDYLLYNLKNLSEERDSSTEFLDQFSEEEFDDPIGLRRIGNIGRYRALEEDIKIDFIKSVKADEFLTKKEYLDFLFTCIKYDVDGKAKVYINKRLLEDTLFSSESEDVEYIKKLLQEKAQKA